MPKGCVISIISSLFVMVAAAVLVIDHFTNYQEIGLVSIFSRYPGLGTLIYLILGMGIIGLAIGLKTIFWGRQEEPYSIRGGLVDKAYKEKKDGYDKI